MGGNIDMVIRGGTIVDGTGGAVFEGDVAVDHGTIVEVSRDGDISAVGREEIDARGCIVTPGFVDVHTHYDGQATWSNRFDPSSKHGVTTVVLGNCGVGFAPCRAVDRGGLMRLMEGVEDIPQPVLAAGLPWTWESFPQYLDALESLPHDIDFGVYVPHSPLRVFVMGERAVRQEMATAGDRSEMASLLKQSITAGALGFATSQTIFHRSSDGEPIPTLAAEKEEYLALAGAMREAGRGITQFVGDWDHPEDVFDLLNSILEISGRPLSFSLTQNHEKPNQWREILQWAENTAKRGHSVTAQVLPRPVGFILGHSLTLNPFWGTPTFGKIQHLPFEQRIVELSKPEVRSAILGEANEIDPKNKLALLVSNYGHMFPLVNPPDYEPAAHTSIEAQAEAKGMAPAALAYDLLLKDGGHNMLFFAARNYGDKNLDYVAEMVRSEATVVGLGDGGAHLGTICDASYSTFFLKEWPRPRPGGTRMNLPNTVRKLTRTAAELVGFFDRGLVTRGYKGDLNVIDLDKLSLGKPEIATDMPAGGRRLMQSATGYRATIVSGQIIYRDGVPTSALPGQLIRGEQPDARGYNPTLARRQ